MTTEIKHQLDGEEATVQLTVLESFVECKEEMKSPFGSGKTVLPVGFNPDQYQSVFIKCEILPENRLLKGIIHNFISGESICHEVVTQYLIENFAGKKLELVETRFCNHYEMQYRYIIL